MGDTDRRARLLYVEHLLHQHPGGLKVQEIADRCRVCRKTTDGEVFNVKLKFAAGVARIIEETVWHPSQEVERQSLLPVIASPPEADAAIS